ncbi:MAG: RNA 2'-phosphotransferase [Chloroflexota bacterium]
MYPEIVRTSKFLSLILRHQPGKIGLALDQNGWADVDELLAKANRFGFHIDRPFLERVVAENDKQRFSFDPERRRIRANQGHSIPVDLGLEPTPPPEFLFHGTARRLLGSIREKGLLRGRRTHVHLSKDEPTALAVGKRHGAPVILKIRSAQMHADGYRFMLSANGVWLTESVPVQYLEFPDERGVYP